MIAAEDPDVIAIWETKLPAAGVNPKQAEALYLCFPESDYFFFMRRNPHHFPE